MAIARINRVTATGLGAALTRQSRRRSQVESDADVIRLLRHQLDREKQKTARLEKHIARLERENDVLAAQAGARRRSAKPAESGVVVEGRQVVNQVQAAKQLGVKQYQISRWVKAGHFQLHHDPARAHPLIFADTLHIPAGYRGGRKRATTTG